jgi:hypothetical protein
MERLSRFLMFAVYLLILVCLVASGPVRAAGPARESLHRIGTAAGPDSPVRDPSTPGVVTTEYGLVRGFQDGQTYAYLGIPFAAPPLGPLRWQPPVPPTPWADELTATVYVPLALGSRGHQPAPVLFRLPV